MNSENPMLPPQAAPIDRTPAGGAAFRNEAGAEASGWFDEYALPIIGTGLGAVV
jgi:hypothetical protein